MSIEGVYGVVYCGALGLGIAVFTAKDGRVEGSDYSGGRYTGSVYEDHDGTVTLDVVFYVPADVTLAQGTAAQALPHARNINHKFPPGFGDGKPQEISSPPGTVTVMVKRISDDFAEVASNGFTIQVAQRLAGPS
jgi:hypothetical protein